MALTIQMLHDNFLSCNICTELYQDPCTLACGHTFCRRCLATFTKTQPDAIKAKSFLCPNCRQMIKVSNPGRTIDDWVKHIKPSFLIVGLLDSFASQSESDQGKKGVSENLCFSCKQSDENTPASSHCIDCDVSICAKCTEGHKAMPGTSHHVIIDLGEDVSVKKKRKVMCKTHNSIIEFCCKDCHKAACQKCCILDHRKCDSIVTIESMVPDMKSVLKEKKQMMMGKIKEMKCAFTQKENKIKEITERQADIQAEMLNVVKTIISLINRKYKQLEDELATLTKKEITGLKGQMKSEEIDIQSYQQRCEFIDQVLTTESEMDMYEMYQMCQSGAIITVSDPDTQMQNKPSTGRIIFVEEQVLESNFSLGRLTVTGENFDPECKPTLVDTIHISTKKGKTYPDPVDIVVVDVDGIETLVVTDYSNKCLKSIYHKNQKKCQSSLPLNNEPLSVAKLEDNQVAVTVVSQNEILKVEVTPDLRLLSALTTKKTYVDLASLNVSTIVASSCDPPSLDILDEKGQVLKSVKIEGELIKWPCFLSTMTNGHILMSDDSYKSVSCLTVEGDVVFTCRPSGESALASPRSITTSSIGDILVADTFNNKVIQLTASGKFVRDLLRLQNEGIRPYAICLHKYKLYVALADGPVNVYQC